MTSFISVKHCDTQSLIPSWAPVRNRIFWDPQVFFFWGGRGFGEVIPSLKLTAFRTWKWMVGIRSFPFGMAYFQGFLLLVSGVFFSRIPWIRIWGNLYITLFLLGPVRSNCQSRSPEVWKDWSIQVICLLNPGRIVESFLHFTISATKDLL